MKYSSITQRNWTCTVHLLGELLHPTTALSKWFNSFLSLNHVPYNNIRCGRAGPAFPIPKHCRWATPWVPFPGSFITSGSGKPANLSHRSSGGHGCARDPGNAWKPSDLRRKRVFDEVEQCNKEMNLLVHFKEEQIYLERSGFYQISDITDPIINYKLFCGHSFLCF